MMVAISSPLSSALPHHPLLCIILTSSEALSQTLYKILIRDVLIESQHGEIINPPVFSDRNGNSETDKSCLS